MDNKIAAKELALKLRAKADLLETLSEEQVDILRKRIEKQGDVGSGCWFVTPCVVVDCFVSSPL
jgi:hypothetical protein